MYSLSTPGIYHRALPRSRTLGAARMDVCAFVGVAPRGPARAPLINDAWPADRPCVEPDRPRRLAAAVSVESWREYQQLFGGFEGPGLLPYAVAAFFEQGGQRAYVVRVVHAQAPDSSQNGTARGVLRGADPEFCLGLVARSEGSWGNRLSAAMSFRTEPVAASWRSRGALLVPEGRVSVGSLLRLRLDGGSFLSFVERAERVHAPELRRWVTVAHLDRATLPAGALPIGGTATIEEVTAKLTIHDGTAVVSESHEGLGFAPQHPRFIAQVLCDASVLVYPQADWVYASDNRTLRRCAPRSVDLPPLATGPFSGGEDHYEEIVPDDFFDLTWTRGDEEAGCGVHTLLNVPDLAMVVVPDLYCAAPLPPRQDGDEGFPGPRDFTEYVPLLSRPETTSGPPTLRGLLIDPLSRDGLRRIIGYQQRLVQLAEEAGSFLVLLDVPPLLSPRQILDWRAQFGSAHAAAYHPWLSCSREDDEREGLVAINPAAVAAGIIAQVEQRAGLSAGPGNVLAEAVVSLMSPLRDPWRDEYHRQQINLFVREPAGIRLTSARTLSPEPRQRQLSVRRVLLMLRRTLQQEMQWAVFEPNGRALRGQLQALLHIFLRQLYQRNFFRGKSEAEAFYVRCNESINPPGAGDAGQLLAEIGVSIAEPLEFIVLSLVRVADGLLLEERQ